MKKNKKFQKDQLAAEGFTDFREIFLETAEKMDIYDKSRKKFRIRSKQEVISKWQNQFTDGTTKALRRFSEDKIAVP